MYKLKIYIFLSEILSVIFTPFILWKTLPESAPAIIDFFREVSGSTDTNNTLLLNVSVFYSLPFTSMALAMSVHLLYSISEDTAT